MGNKLKSRICKRLESFWNVSIFWYHSDRNSWSDEYDLSFLQSEKNYCEVVSSLHIFPLLWQKQANVIKQYFCSVAENPGKPRYLKYNTVNTC